MIEALVANRLTSPQPLWRVADWARSWAIDEVFDIGPDALDDDRIGRALDAVAPHLERIVGSVGARAIGGVRVGGGPAALSATGPAITVIPPARS